MPLPPNATIYEINTWIWLNELSANAGRTLRLQDVPDAELERLAGLKLDAIWLMGVWHRSPAAHASALNYEHEYRGALPDIRPEDILGSAYAVGDNRVDEQLGGAKGLASLRRRLQERGMRLILDFVPNHVALDHPWIGTAPQYFVRGDESIANANPGHFTRVSDQEGNPYWVAHGRDPYFPSWIDTAQLNAFAAEYRSAARDSLLDIAAQCDGVRCDMAMLLLNDVFHDTWWQYLGQARPAEEFWPALIDTVRQEYPDFTFLAEVYWNLEERLLSQGFDLCYHKSLYDRLMQWDCAGLRVLLQMRLSTQKNLLNFIENHDEPRAMERLGPARQRVAATLIATLPSPVLLHQGQLRGRRTKLPVQISRQPIEALDDSLYTFYERLLQERAREIYRAGEWELVAAPAPLLCYSWKKGDDWCLVALNFASERVPALLNTPIIGDALVVDALATNEHERRAQVIGGLFTLEIAAYGAEIWRPALNSRI